MKKPQPTQATKAISALGTALLLEPVRLRPARVTGLPVQTIPLGTLCPLNRFDEILFLETVLPMIDVKFRQLLCVVLLFLILTPGSSEAEKATQ
ncbi:hypothetical protein [Wenzhouxiangella limi]|uniref:Uncharacterized protein n=1 Tax=Wenzhouxiangella limi TaxID=2707351 RepID=A0A845UYQ3_9GAMM|nr:hypothetical protein [Wenzhouxiangella limi]NDY95010.1 hypothetical protein [Wenzhouxiangella limi]